jgi:hypothetical protein
VIVVPDSGTGELLWIAGKLRIKIVEKKHFYEFEYTLPEAARLRNELARGFFCSAQI